MNYTLREGKSLSIGEKVEVYYNIHKGGFSIKSLDKSNISKGLVCAYASNLSIINATFHLSIPTLEKIIQRHVKDVYAVVRGTLESIGIMDNSEHKKGYCNPYSTGKFIDWDSKEEIKNAETVYFYDKYFSYI